MSKKIVGITIGPIVETISESRKISEIGNASLFFSTIMFEFLKEVKNSGKYNIITPYFNEKDENKKDKLYPDRAILEVRTSVLNDKEVLEKIEKLKEKSFNNFIKDDESLFLNKLEESELKKYINFNIVVVNIEEEKDIKNIFGSLDGIELIKSFPIEYSEQKILKDIEDVLKSRKKLNEEKTNINEGNYRAIITLDLDNMGKFSQEKIEKIQEVSKGIYEYVNHLSNFIKQKRENESKKSEGLLLYSAGDDILAILNPKHIFSFIREAGNSLNTFFGDMGNQNLSVSFGIFICYKKNPIKESIEKSHELLFGKAKQGEKNAVEIVVQKHSGQSFEILLNDLVTNLKLNEGNLIFNKLECYTKYYGKKLEKEEFKRRERMLNTIIQKVYQNSFILKQIIKDEKRINYFLNNLFEKNRNENILIQDLYELLLNLGKNLNEKDINEKIEGNIERTIFDEGLEKVISYFKLIKFFEDINKEKEEGEE